MNPEPDFKDRLEIFVVEYLRNGTRETRLRELDYHAIYWTVSSPM